MSLYASYMMDVRTGNNLMLQLRPVFELNPAVGAAGSRSGNRFSFCDKKAVLVTGAVKPHNGYRSILQQEIAYSRTALVERLPFLCCLFCLRIFVAEKAVGSFILFNGREASQLFIEAVISVVIVAHGNLAD